MALIKAKLNVENTMFYHINRITQSLKGLPLVLALSCFLTPSVMADTPAAGGLPEIAQNTANTNTSVSNLTAGYGASMLGALMSFIPNSAVNNQSAAAGLATVDVAGQTATNTGLLLSQLISEPKNPQSYLQRYGMCVPGGKLWSATGHKMSASMLQKAIGNACQRIAVLPSVASPQDPNQTKSDNQLQYSLYPQNAALNFNNFIGQLGYKLNPAQQEKTDPFGGSSSQSVVDNNAADNVAPAFDFIRYISGALTPLTLPDFLSESTSNLDVANKQMNDVASSREKLKYLLSLRSYLTQLSIGVGNFVHMATERQRTIDNSQKVSYSYYDAKAKAIKQTTVNHPIIPNGGDKVSPAQIERYTMSHRVQGQQWLHDVQSSNSTLALQRQMVIMQAQELKELYRIHMTLERMNAALSASQLNRLSMDRQQLAQSVDDEGKVQTPASQQGE